MTEKNTSLSKVLVLAVNAPVEGSIENMSVALSRVNLILVWRVFARSLSVAFTFPIKVPEKHNTNILKYAKESNFTVSIFRFGSVSFTAFLVYMYRYVHMYIYSV